MEERGASAEGADGNVTTPAPTLAELARVFLVLGATSVGGPAAHVAMLREEVVVRRRWVSEARFVELLGVVNLLPGPNSTELAIHLGKDLAGVRGLMVAGLGFIVPAVLITGAAAMAYVRAGARPELGALFWGVKPVVTAIVVHAIVGLAPAVLRSRRAQLLAATAFAASVAGAHELAVLVACGAACAAAENQGAGERASHGWGAFGGAPALAASTTAAGALVSPVAGPASLFVVFAKIGAVLYGSGYVLVAFLRAELVERHGWITEAQLLDAVAVGQATPGPVFTTATFLGYLLAGAPGAIAATLGIFAPAFAFVAAADPLVSFLRRSRRGCAFLEGVNVASLALMAHVALSLARAAVTDAVTGIVAAAAAYALVMRLTTPTKLLAVGAALGVVRALA
jgi:chromate transporter